MAPVRLFNVRSRHYICCLWLVLLFLTSDAPIGSLACPVQTERTSRNNHGRSLMVGGTNTKPGQYPFHTQVGCCSGALVAPDIVLTAGHDLPPLDVAVGMTVYVNAYYTNPLNHTAHAHTISQAVLHPNYTVIHNDFALLVLQEPVQDDSWMVRLNRDNSVPKPHQDVTILGMGTFNLTTTERSTVLQSGTSTYLPNDECAKQGYDVRRGISYRNNFLDETNLCTFGAVDGCVFDSGGPIVVKTADESDVLIALVSYGVDCADPIYPAVNARVSAVHGWIDEMVCQYSTNPPADFACQKNTNRPESGATNATLATSPEALEASFLPFQATTGRSLEPVLLFVGVSVVVGISMVLLQRLYKSTWRRERTQEVGERQRLLPRGRSIEV